jgi:hypothetical protein
MMRWKTRHILIDHFSKMIKIQVMWHLNGTGQLNEVEYQKIKRGEFAEFLPQGLTPGDIFFRKVLRELIGSGYKVVPMFFEGQQNDEGTIAFIMCTDIGEPRLTQFDVPN